jgi:hypothetical protein
MRLKIRCDRWKRKYFRFAWKVNTPTSRIRRCYCYKWKSTQPHDRSPICCLVLEPPRALGRRDQPSSRETWLINWLTRWAWIRMISISRKYLVPSSRTEDWRRSWALAPLPPRGHCNTTLRTSYLEAEAERDLRYLPSFLHSVSSF